MRICTNRSVAKGVLVRMGRDGHTSDGRVLRGDMAPLWVRMSMVGFVVTVGVVLSVPESALAQVVVNGNLTVSSGASAQTWYGVVGVLWGASSQTVNGNLTIDFAPNGIACMQDSMCASGHCSSGYCCNSACNDGCDTCSLTGSLGTCLPQSAGAVCSPPQGPCGAGSTCDGSSVACPTATAGVLPAGTVCQQPRGPCEAAARCDGSTVNCAPVYMPAGIICGNGVTCGGTSPYCVDGSGNSAGFEARTSCQ